MHIVGQPSVILAMLNPMNAVYFFTADFMRAFIAMGSVVLAVTGAEALYADMGHFGRKPIRISWVYFVLPALLLNYMGQGAMLLSADPAEALPRFGTRSSTLLPTCFACRSSCSPPRRR